LIFRLSTEVSLSNYSFHLTNYTHNSNIKNLKMYDLWRKKGNGRKTLAETLQRYRTCSP